jgi:hypothetical protein
LSTLDGGVGQMVDEIRDERAQWPEVVKASHVKLAQ